ncbi:tRNA preQ1(34) S-adenosylmethionine ribosyltransferase-isomerase QueA [Gemelliphila asaccharolytica]|uniref:S-adenosylmethionine:tRNA ribosyltransferase-isomerase n=1 Tax=Gemelliphila asaccharolytica TaxID=502393 RepID=A0ABR5TMU0_9BACL|nr:tRNA preQ1(34) S-adenosylmethionine ribosyltransferase-isomerase QueA [Gemella asaccharolytica]KXB58648.1 S-adenosylmethionine:tRNA ribosyltransferase-isomerase [Gemella asaccharolytica]
MKLENFDYKLPNELIAQHPMDKRDESRLLVVDKDTDQYQHKKFYNLIDYLNSGDTLVLNDTRVMPARLFGKKITTGALIEILLLKNKSNDVWECLVKPAKRVAVGTIVDFNGIMRAECIEAKDDGFRYFKFTYEGIFQEKLEILGTMPLPPYIKEQLKDNERYQTVYSKNLGSAAAPTAGLHFTKQLLNDIKEKGINVCYITLHVGIGTFRPVVVNEVENHKMHSEFYQIDEKTAEIINETKKNNKKIIAVGTTTIRTLETVAKNNNGKIVSSSGFTDIFIYPGFKFRCVDSLVTNFHLPKSTLIMLVSAFYNREKILNIYNIAVKEKYRFFSFGDAMLIH